MLKRKSQRRSRRRRDPNAKLLGPAQLLEERNEREVKISHDADDHEDVRVGDATGEGRQMYRSESVDTYDASTSFDSTSQGSSLESKESSLKPAAIPPSPSSSTGFNPINTANDVDQNATPLLDLQRVTSASVAYATGSNVTPAPTGFEKVPHRPVTSPLLAVTEGKDQDDGCFEENDCKGKEEEDGLGKDLDSGEGAKRAVEPGDGGGGGDVFGFGFEREVVMKSIGTQSQPEEALSEAEVQDKPCAQIQPQANARTLAQTQARALVGAHNAQVHHVHAHAQAAVVSSGDVCKASVETGLREKRVSPAPKEVGAYPMSKTGLMSQLRSQVQMNLNLGTKVPSMLGLGDLQIDQYLPGVVRQLASGGEEGWK